MRGFAHRDFPVYRLAIELLALGGDAVREVDPLYRALVWQLLRAVHSIALNIAEGADESSPGDKARFYRYARRSAAETSAAVDGLAALRQLTPEFVELAHSRCNTIAAHLTRLIRTLKA
ncbi:MAG: four helix bundle protein [Longimicrobiales bacterium]